MRNSKILIAMREGVATAMAADETTFIVGEGIANRGGVFTESTGLLEKFGPERIMDMPLSENAFLGMCAGAAMCGSRAICDIMFSDFLTLSMSPLVDQAIKIPYMSGGQFKMPLTILAFYGVSGSNGAQHSQSLHPWFMHIPGIKVVVPSTPYDMKGLLASAILDDNVALVLRHRALIHQQGELPEEDYFLPLGKAEVVRQGADVTVVAPGIMRHRLFNIAENLSGLGIEIELIDPRTLTPLDTDTICESVKKTNHLVVVDEAYSPCGFGAEVIATVQDQVFDYLDAPLKRIHPPSVPVPFSTNLEQAYLPNDEMIIREIKKVLSIKV